jgi:enoyl-CoA hydratase
MKDIVVEVSGGVATVTIDRPPVNAVTMAHYEHLGAVFADLGSSLDVNCAILTGTGSRAFCAGLDLKEFLAATVEDDAARRSSARRSTASATAASR